MAPGPLPVLVNREGGAAANAGEGLRDQIAAAFAATGVAVKIDLLAPEELPHAVEDAANRSARIVVAGGDGTLACAAQALSGYETELAILPLGTLNHLARDLDIPPELEAAAELAAHGRAAPIDVGTVNGQRFVNNVSIGIYPRMVRERDAVREDRAWPKWLATVPAALNTVARLPHHRLRVSYRGRDEMLVTPLLFVGNGIYSLEQGEVGCRTDLKGGKLGIYAVGHRTRAALLWFAVRTLLGRADPRADFVLIGESEDLRVQAHRDRVEIAMDGEVKLLASPLRFGVDARALRVVTVHP